MRSVVEEKADHVICQVVCPVSKGGTIWHTAHTHAFQVHRVEATRFVCVRSLSRKIFVA